MPQKSSKKPKKEQPPAEPDPAETVPKPLHSTETRPLKVSPIGGVPPNLPKQFPGKGPKNFNTPLGKGRNFRHQGR